MKGTHIAIADYRGCDVAVLLRDGRLEALEIDPPGAPHPRWGDVYQGVISRIDTNLGSAFVRLDKDNEGYMPLPKKNEWYSGQTMTVRVMASPSSAAKSVRVAPLKEKEDGQELTLLQGGPNAAHRLLQNHGPSADVIEPASTQTATQLAAAYPALEDKFMHPGTAKARKDNLLDMLGAADQLDALSARTVHLNDGGDIIIEGTRAMTVIDVNSGSRAALDTNLAAAEEITRQLRLRNIGGIIIADMINMPRSAERKLVLDAFEDALAADTCQTKLHGFTKLGLLEISRARRTPSLAACLSATGGS